MKSPLTLLILLSVIGGASAAAAETWHVAPPPLGDDAHAGTAASPFATLDQARLAVRSWLAGHEQRADLVVELRAGTYELPTAVHFDAADSGRNGFAIVYRAAPGAKVILSGGRRISGWTAEPNSGGNWRAEVSREVDFRQLWVGDRRAVRARTPNLGRTFTLADDKKPDGLDLPRAPLAGIEFRPGETELSVLIAWMHKRLRIARLADTSDPATVRAVIAAPEWDAVMNQPQGDRVYRGRAYWLENNRGFLDAPGEFYLDRATGILRYRPRPGEDPASARIIRPELENLIVLDGRPDAPVHHLRFERLGFAHTGWTRPDRTGFVDVQANSLVPADPASAVDEQYRHRQRKDRIPAAFQAATADLVVIRGCRFEHLGGAGVVFTHGGDDNVIEGNSFYDLAAGGIELGEDAARPDTPRLIPRRNRIANNFLTHVGEDYFGSVAILGYYTNGSVITHNEIASLPYTAISQGWGWGSPPAPPESRGNRITHNRITNFMRRVDDGGGIYTTDRQPGSEIAGNVVTRMLPPDPDTKAGGALYLDQFTSGFHVHHNVVAESIRWLYIWNPNIRGNRIEANWADTAAQRDDGTDNVVAPVTVCADRGWPAAAQAVRASAGLEPAFASARAYTDAREIVVEATGVDFQIVAGRWRTVDHPRDSYGGAYWESTDAQASARWLPVLPTDGLYDIAVWTPAGSPSANYTLVDASGERHLAPSGVEAPTSAGWRSLGRHALRAGASTEIRIGRRTSDVTPLQADALRLVRTPD